MKMNFDRLAVSRLLRTSLLAFLACLAVAIGAPAIADKAAPTATPAKDQSLQAIIATVVGREPTMTSYAAHAVLDIRQTNFPYLHPVLNGMQYYSRPGLTIVDLDHVPWYLNGISKIEGATLDANRWPHCYTIAVEQRSSGHLLHMVRKIRGEVDHIDVTVAESGEIPHIEWFYHNAGDHVVLDQLYEKVNGYRVVTKQMSQITLHHIHALGTSSFTDFNFNTPVPTPTPTPTEPLRQCDN
ncbi:MAG TPA: hypothetical protein VII69_00815 [Candidatus Eremiobacteraceae bacterium]